MSRLFDGLVAATHTPFHADGSLNLAVIERQAEHLSASGVGFAFIGGSTGESHSLTLEERLKLAEKWLQVARGSSLKVVVHVGSNCLEDARVLSAQAQSLGAIAVSALSPSYFKPRNIGALVDCCGYIASAAPGLPFYFYDIPVLTGVNLSMPEFLQQAGKKIPNLGGLKFTNVDFVSFQKCVEQEDHRFEILWGVDEMLLGALAFGAQGAVGSTYNFAPSIYHRLIQAFHRNDLATARLEQGRSIRLVDILVSRGYMGSAKAMMQMLGVPVGPPRLPNQGLSGEQFSALREELARENYL